MVLYPQGLISGGTHMMSICPVVHLSSSGDNSDHLFKVMSAKFL